MRITTERRAGHVVLVGTAADYHICNEIQVEINLRHICADPIDGLMLSEAKRTVRHLQRRGGPLNCRARAEEVPT